MMPCFNDWKRLVVTVKNEIHQIASRLPLGGLAI
jgi:hypothetical protein